MSSKYQKPFTIPEGFPALLKAFSREILRVQPANICEFGASYFADLLEKKVNGEPLPFEQGAWQTVEPEASTAMPATELEELILRLFVSADQDSSGYLDRSEFAHVLRSADLNLSERQIRKIIAEVDENEDGVIQYSEFIPFMVDLISTLQAAEEASRVAAAREADAEAEAEALLVHGMTPEQLEQLMLGIFNRTDTDGSGFLSRKELKQCLQSAEMGLTRGDINTIMAEVDANQDGRISYAEFAPLCISILLQRFKDELLLNEVLTSKDSLHVTLIQSFQEADPEGMGVLPPKAVQEVLQALSFQALGLTQFQILSLVAQAPRSPDGMVEYIKFVAVAASMIHGMYSADGQRLRLAAITRLGQEEAFQQMATLDLEGLRSLLLEAFANADVDGSGALSLPEVQTVLQELAANYGEMLRLTPTHLEVLFLAIDDNGDGQVNTGELAGFICDLLQHVEREQMVQQLAREAQ